MVLYNIINVKIKIKKILYHATQRDSGGT